MKKDNQARVVKEDPDNSVKGKEIAEAALEEDLEVASEVVAVEEAAEVASDQDPKVREDHIQEKVATTDPERVDMIDPEKVAMIDPEKVVMEAKEKVVTEKVATVVEVAQDHTEVEIDKTKTPTIDPQEEKVATAVVTEIDTETDQVQETKVVTSKAAKEEAVSAEVEVVVAANTKAEALQDNNNTEE